MPSTSISPEKIKDFNYLVNNIREKHATHTSRPKYALLIGAGCSRNSGIPLGGGIIQLCQQLSFLANKTTDGKEILDNFNKTADYKALDEYINSNHGEAFKLYVEQKNQELANRINNAQDEETKKLQEFLPDAQWADYAEAIAVDAQYGYWQDAFSEDPKERQQLIERLIESKEPGGAYILLAYLVQREYFSNILTTNFDDFINETLLYYTDVRCRFYADDELSQYIALVGHRPNIVKLHEDYRFANMKNTSEETHRLSANLEQKMGELLKDFGLVVMGYNGADHSIMNTLRRIKQYSSYGLIWCGMDEQQVHWRVAELINNTRNSFFIKMEGFDELVGQLYVELCRGTQPYNLMQKATERQQKVTTTLKQFGLEFNASNAPESTKDDFDKLLNAWEVFDQAYNEKDADKKIELYNQVIDIEPYNAYAYNNRGTSWNDQKEYDKALADLAKAIELDPTFTKAYNNRGNSWYGKKEYDRALADYTNAIELDPNYAMAYSNRGNSWNNQKEYDRAIADLTKAIELYPTYAIAYNNRGNSWHAKEEYDKALVDYTKAIELDPTYLLVYRNRGNSWNKKKEYDKALTDYTKALELNPTDSSNYNSIANVYRLKGTLDIALEKAKMGIEKFPNDAFLHGTLAEIYTQQGNTELFYDTIEKALQLEYPVKDFLDDEAYTLYKNEPRFTALLAKYDKTDKPN